METRRGNYSQQEIDAIDVKIGAQKSITLSAEDALVLRGFIGSMSVHRMEKAAGIKRDSNGFLASGADERAFDSACRVLLVLGKVHQQLR